jgi:hypothetical protein
LHCFANLNLEIPELELLPLSAGCSVMSVLFSSTFELRAATTHQSSDSSVNNPHRAILTSVLVWIRSHPRTRNGSVQIGRHPRYALGEMSAALIVVDNAAKQRFDLPTSGLDGVAGTDGAERSMSQR